MLKHHPEGLPLSLLTRRVFPNIKGDNYSNDYKRCYMHLYREISKRPNLISTKKITGLKFCFAEREAFDLVQADAKLQPSKKDPFGIPKNCHRSRRKAIQICLSRDRLTSPLKHEIHNHYEAYREDVDQRFCVLHRRKHDPEGRNFIAIRYKTRFTDQRWRAKTLDKFDGALDNSLKNFKTGVFLTLTTDPKRFRSVWEANRHLGKAWNRFLSYLTKRCKFRPKYIASYEYTEVTGLIHIHVLFFGLRWLVGKYEITDEWERCGQGSYNYVYSVFNRGGKWLWKKSKPQKAKGKDAGDYLKYYAKKAVFEDATHHQYWVYNKRFFTCSYSLNPPSEGTPWTPPLWEFLGAFTLSEMPSFVFKVHGLRALLGNMI